MAKVKRKYTMGTYWFLLIIIVSIIGAVLPGNETIFWLILGICGAIVAIMNIRIREEVSFLIGTSALLIVIISLFILTPTLVVSNIFTGRLTIVGDLLVNLAIAFGVAGLVVSLGLISRLGIEK